MELSKSSQERIAQEIINFAPSSRTLLDPNVMILSNNELGRIIELPSAKLQDDFNFQSVQRREVKIPDALKKGIPTRKSWSWRPLC